ncbi:hypothetical protein BUE80_DR001978, partial [Diplocarpon rosae]
GWGGMDGAGQDQALPTFSVDPTAPAQRDAAALGPDGLLDELAAALVAEEGRPEGRLDVRRVVLAHDPLDVLAGLPSVVEGDGGDQVVADVRADDVVEEVRVDEAQVPVDGGRGAAGEVPGLVVVVRHGGVGVLEERDGHYGRSVRACVLVHPQPRDPPEDDDIPAPEQLSGQHERRNHDRDPDVRQHDQGQLVRLEEHAVLPVVEMADLGPLGAVVLLARQIEQQLCKLDHVRARLGAELRLDPGFAGMRHERRVLLHVSRRLVVLAVAQSPRVEGHQQEGVHDEAHGVVEVLVLGEGAVAALVGQDPDAGEDEALHGGVGHPGGEAQLGSSKTLPWRSRCTGSAGAGLALVVGGRAMVCNVGGVGGVAEERRREGKKKWER